MDIWRELCRGRAAFRHEWANRTSLIPHPHSSMGSGKRLSSGNMSARLPLIPEKKSISIVIAKLLPLNILSTSSIIAFNFRVAKVR